jgi:phosphopentomutase
MGAAAPRRPFDRFVVVVCDSVGCGEAPDAADFGDVGANTLASVIRGARPELPNLARLGLDRIAGVPPLHKGSRAPRAVGAAWGRMTERSGAKDTLSGHWELMCVESEEGFPVYPEGFPPDVMQRFEEAIGRATLGNYPASGTEIIRELGEEHVRSGAPIVYTSGDSVFQVAAHEDVIRIDELYDICSVARRQLDGPHRVARVIARPFVGADADSFERTPRRRDLALPPPAPTALDLLVEAGYRTWGVGKIHDIFAGRGLSGWVKTVDNADGVDKTIEAIADDAGELIFTNLVEFDSKYGHRRDVAGYAAALKEFDRALPRLMDALGPGDCLVITADHGNDPAFAGTDHTRERVPLLVYSGHTPRHLGTRETFADLGQTVLDNFGLEADRGESFLADIIR